MTNKYKQYIIYNVNNKEKVDEDMTTSTKQQAMTGIYTLKDINRFFTELVMEELAQGAVINQHYPKDTYSQPVRRADELFLILEKGNQLIMVKFEEIDYKGSFELIRVEGLKEEELLETPWKLSRKGKRTFERRLYEVCHGVYMSDEEQREAALEKRKARKERREQKGIYHEIEVITEVKGFKNAVLRHNIGDERTRANLELVNRNGRSMILGILGTNDNEISLSLTWKGREIKELLKTIKKRQTP